MRLRSGYLILIAITLCCLLIACGDDRNPTKSSSSLTTFWRTYDLGGYEYFTSLAQGSGGAIVAGGLANIRGDRLQRTNARDLYQQRIHSGQVPAER